ncbi:methyl-accepting chemotaxis protein [Marinospirillum perlucidum]|uniref:methyl-accepting chemotaxis protein n=1 Tax=Marinospirillum perlucidum TaxID=1982602 RepID=UPI000DF1F498|nr:methyl-accepting chemotaxis protein [Marinospirillum perlucidum]
MQSIKNWSLKHKIRLPLLLAALLIIYMNASSYLAMNSLLTQVKSFDEDYFPAISAVLNADRDLYQNLVALREQRALLAAGSRQGWDSLDADRTDNYTQALERGLHAIDYLGAVIPQERKQEYQELMERWQRHSEELLQNPRLEERTELFEAPRELLNSLGERIDSLAQDSSTQAAATLEQQTFMQLVQLAVLVIAFILAGILAPRFLVTPIESLRNRMKDVAQGEGDLTARIPVNSKDELGQVADAFNQVMEKLRQSISVVKEVNSDVTERTQLLHSTAASNIQLTERQQEIVDQVVVAMEEMHSAAREIASNSNAGAEAANQAHGSVDQGVDISSQSSQRVRDLSRQLSQSSEAIGHLADEAESVGSVLDVIKGIAEQTNLLALNAAIEAARAGDQGRGFAVVAEEVRALASQTQSSTEDIREKIEKLQEGASGAVKAIQQGLDLVRTTVEDVERSTDAFTSIQGAVSEITNMSLQTATATEEQTNVVGEINENLQSIADYSSQSNDSSRSLNDLATALKQQTDQLNLVVGAFKV